MNDTKNGQRGVTLLELMIVLAVAGVLLSVGVPSFRNVIMDNRLTDQSNAFMAAVASTRSAAVRFQRNATICPLLDYEAALPSCNPGTDWSNGWMVWVDRDRDGAASAGEIVSVQEPMQDALTFESVGADPITYNARGFLTAGANDLELCDSRSGEEGRVIRINGVGRTEVARQVCT